MRGLVEFTLHGADIGDTANLRDMQEGVFGHKGRQASLGVEWQAEVPLSLILPLDEEHELILAGRMDALKPGDQPVIEEIKLWQGKKPPEEPEAAHRAQAVVYGHMLCERDGLSAVGIRVAYVDRDGRERAVFPEKLTRGGCAAEFGALWENWLRRWRLMREHAANRDATLRHMRFPYENWRPGQREMAAQVYTAIARGRRLFAEMPTGTGKSAAALFPALKALGEGHTGQVFYLTARTTQRQGPLDALALLRRQPLRLWTLVLDAKDRQCPDRTVCHPDWCPRAKGHYLRDAEALVEMLQRDDWTPEAIREAADRHMLCPFEFSLSLCELADLVICDMNYALDPAVHIQRIFDMPGEVTLLIDEAHNLPDRVREMLSGRIDGAALRRLRTEIGKTAGRKHPLYKALGGVMRALTDLPVQEGEREGLLHEVPQSLARAAEELIDCGLDAQKEHLHAEGLMDAIGDILGFRRALRGAGDHAVIWQGVRNRTVTLQAMDISEHFFAVTERMCGTVCFSATFSPLPRMKELLGGAEEDACFAMPSAFPPENLLTVRVPVNTRYEHRAEAAPQIAEAIGTMVMAYPGRHIAYFPSYAFMEMVEKLLTVPHRTQGREMSIPEREAFLRPFREKREPCLALCVLGGVFSEGIDLPGDALDGVAVVSVGLPQVGIFRETLRAWHEARGEDGFLYAYRIPGMQKAAQAVGRVIRTETDRGVALLVDDRYRQRDYLALCPPTWRIVEGDLKELLEAFRREGEKHDKSGAV